MNNLIEIVLSFLKSFFSILQQVLFDILVMILNALLFLIKQFIEFAASIMPSLEIGVDLIHRYSTPHQAICFLNWIFPVDVLIVCMTTYIGVYISTFLPRFVMRFVKLIK